MYDELAGYQASGLAGGETQLLEDDWFIQTLRPGLPLDIRNQFCDGPIRS